MLTDTALRSIKPAEKPQKFFDERGLFLLVNPTGSRLWRFKYQFKGKEKLLSLGQYPDTSLKKARERRDELRRQLANGIDPSAERQSEREAHKAALNNTVREVGEACFRAPANEPTQEKQVSRPIVNGKPRKPKWKEERRRLEMYIYPKLGERPIASVTKDELGSEINKIVEAGKLELARRVKIACHKLWQSAVDSSKCAHNIVADLKRIKKPKGRRHHASIKEPRRYGDLLRSIEAYGGRAETATQYALKLLPLIFLRSSEIRWSRWSWVNFETAEWRIPAEIMKREDPHIVPLSRQALFLLRGLHEHFGHQAFMFPALRSGRPICENTLNCALRSMGFPKEEMTAHGVRSFASTQLREHQWPGPCVEIQLAHLVKADNEVEAAYNYAQYLPLRRIMMQWWSDYLDSLKVMKAKPAIPYATVRSALAEQSFLHDPTIGSPVDLLRGISAAA